MIFLGVLTLVTAGAIAVGLVFGTPGTDVIVQNATDATYGSPLGTTSFTLDLTSSVSSDGTSGFITQIRQINYSPRHGMIVTQTAPARLAPGQATPAQIVTTLKEYAAITNGTGWAQSGSTLTRTEPFASFYDRINRATSSTSTAVGTVRETVVVRGGYLVLLRLNAVVTHQARSNGAVAPGAIVNETYRFLRINGHPPPALTS